MRPDMPAPCSDAPLACWRKAMPPGPSRGSRWGYSIWVNECPHCPTASSLFHSLPLSIPPPGPSRDSRLGYSTWMMGERTPSLPHCLEPLSLLATVHPTLFFAASRCSSLPRIHRRSSLMPTHHAPPNPPSPFPSSLFPFPFFLFPFPFPLFPFFLVYERPSTAWIATGPSCPTGSCAHSRCRYGFLILSSPI